MDLDNLAANSIVYIATIMMLWILTGFAALTLGIYPKGYTKIDLILLIIVSASYQPVAYLTYRNWKERGEEKQ